MRSSVLALLALRLLENFLDSTGSPPLTVIFGEKGAGQAKEYRLWLNKIHRVVASDIRSAQRCTFIVASLRLILNTGAEADSWNSKFAGSSLVIERRVCAPGW